MLGQVNAVFYSFLEAGGKLNDDISHYSAKLFTQLLQMAKQIIQCRRRPLQSTRILLSLLTLKIGSTFQDSLQMNHPNYATSTRNLRLALEALNALFKRLNGSEILKLALDQFENQGGLDWLE